MDAIDRFVTRENIKRYRKLASATTVSTERSRILKFLSDEVAKVKAELRRRSDAPEELPPVHAATETRVGHDGEEQRRSG